QAVLHGWQANILDGIAEWSLELGRIDAAADAVQRELELRLAMGDRQATVFTLAQVARVETRQGRPGLAGLAWGAVEGEEGRRHVPWYGNREPCEAEVLASRTSEFEAARQRGRSLPLEEAVEAVLGLAQRDAT